VKVLRRLKIELPKEMIDGLVNCKQGYIEQLLHRIRHQVSCIDIESNDWNNIRSIEQIVDALYQHHRQKTV
jgi:hypothetical protein